MTGLSSASERILIVADSTTGPIARGISALRAAGIPLVIATDVYEAMAILATRHSIKNVLLDARSLDNAELSFATLASRYFTNVEVVIAALDGTSDRLAGHPDAARVMTIDAFLASLATAPLQAPTTPLTRIEQSQAESDTPQTSAPPPRLSTDGGIDAVEPGPSLHEAVRMRMKGNDPRVVRRRPPSKDSPSNEMGPSSDTDAALRISREEIEALLQPKIPAPEAPNAPREGPGGTQ